MSERTADLMLLLFHDGVDQEELKALISSAFTDGVNFAVQYLEGMSPKPDG